MVLVPYTLKHLGYELYGYIGLANTAVSYIDIISVALNSMAGRYIAVNYHRGQKEQASIYYSSILVANLLLTGMVSVVGFFAIDNIDNYIIINSSFVNDVKFLFIWILFNYFCTLLCNAFSVSTVITKRLDLTYKVNIFSVLFRSGVVFGMLEVFVPHVWYIGFATAVSGVVYLIFHVNYKKRAISDIVFLPGYFSWNCLSEFLKYGIWSSFNTIGNMLNNGLDLLISNLMLQGTLTGKISIAEHVGILFYSSTKAVTSSFYPEQLESYAKGKNEVLINQLKKVMRINSVLCSVVIAVYYSCGYDFLRLWLGGAEVDMLFELTVITILTYIITGVVNPLYNVFTLTKKLALPFWVNITTGLMNATGIYLLIKNTPLGAYAVVLTTMVLNCVHLIDTPLYAAHCLKVSLKTFYSIIFLHLVCCTINSITINILDKFLFTGSNWILLGIKILIYGMIAVFISFLILTSREEKKVSLKMGKKIFHGLFRL